MSGLLNQSLHESQQIERTSLGSTLESRIRRPVERLFSFNNLIFCFVKYGLNDAKHKNR
ncbi:hypothetical protein PHIN6_03210 [Polynucleobacter sp. HIN6]|nr:hypothetical protein PHIN6_03210 [Polynucleobacter sp. HIN6]